MIQTRNQYLQFMLVMLAAWGISWGARFVMEQAVLLYGIRKNYLFFSHGTVLMYLLCVFPVYRRWIARYRSLVSCATLAYRGWSVRWPWCMSVYFCSVRRWLCLLSHL